jgi:hypothetical protein
VDFAAVLSQLKRFFEQHQVRYALAGAFALHAHGITRATGDLDFVVEESGKESLRRFLGELGYDELYVSEGFSNHLHRDGALGRLDFIYVDPHTADRLFSAAQPMPVLPGLDAPVPRPEHLAAMKVLAMKNDPSRTFQDMADIQALLGLPNVDKQEIQGYFDRHGLGEKFAELEEPGAARQR